MTLFKRNKRKPTGNELQSEILAEGATSLTHLTLQSPNGPQQTTPNQPPDLSTSSSTKRAAWREWLSELNWRRLLAVTLFSFVCVAAVSFALLWQFEDNAVSRQTVGEVALADVMAPRTQTYVSAVKTKELGDQAANNLVNRVYRRDTNIVITQRDGLIGTLNLVETARVSGATGVNNAALTLAGLDNIQITALLNLPESSWNQVNQEARSTFNIMMSRDILPSDTNTAINILRNAVYAPYTISASFAQLSEAERELAVALVKPFIKANNTLDEAATRKKQDEARKEVGSAEVSVIKGTAIVRRGDVLTALQIEQLRELGLRSNNYTFNSIVGTVGVVSILILLLVFYCIMLAGQIWTTPRWLFFIAVAIIVSAVAMRVLIVDATKDSSRPFLLPLAAVAMVLAALFDVNLALFLAALLAVLAGLVSGSPELVVVYFAGSAAGALSLRKAEHTSVFAYAAIATATAQFAVGLCANLLLHNLENFSVALLFFFSILNGLISASLAFFCFSVLGKLFGVATVLQLLELAHPNQPLLRRLIREAPGTYHHSIMVSNLAEQAAERIADNALLARVGAYYHDIGKLTRPNYYIDNQGGGVNIHDTLDPRESARLIKEHVSDGVALARKHKLPRRVVDIIHQHHGTCVISYFYQRAVKLGLEVDELDFRYPGPKPQTKVSAIVMLADGCEAAVRANVQSGRISTGTRASVPAAHNPEHNHTPKQLTIRDVVDKIVDDRIRDGQLSECDLTLRDIEEIRNLFVESLNGIYHPRIAYPEKEPAPTSEKEVIVTGSAREVPTSLVPVKPEPTRITNSLGAADGGGNSEPPLTDPRPTGSSETQLPTRKLNPGKGGIGGAGRRIKN